MKKMFKILIKTKLIWFILFWVIFLIVAIFDKQTVLAEICVFWLAVAIYFLFKEIYKKRK